MTFKKIFCIVKELGTTKYSVEIKKAIVTTYSTQNAIEENSTKNIVTRKV